MRARHAVSLQAAARAGRAAATRHRVGARADGRVGVLDWRGEFAGGEGFEGAEAGVHFGGGEAAVAEEPAEKIGGRAFAFQRIAFEAARDQVAVGIRAALGERHDVVEDLDARVGASQAIETVAALAEREAPLGKWRVASDPPKTRRAGEGREKMRSFPVRAAPRSSG